jgi:DNA adenine methylase
VRKLIPWVGGKAVLAKVIVPLLPEHTCYVEVFAGGAAVFCLKQPSHVEVLNDRNLGLVGLFRVRATVTAIHARLRHTIIEDLPWKQVVKRYDRPHTCFYVDPPYYEVGKLYGPGLDFSREDHAALAAALRTVKGVFLLSLNDRPEVRELYAWAGIRKVAVRYGLGCNTTRTERRGKVWGEVLITNRPWRDGAK